MTYELRCPRNHPVPFAEEDRGGEVYCPICGVVCAVPLADEPPAAPVRRPRIFSDDGIIQAAETSAGVVACPRCREAVPYTVADYGETVYCRRCGSAVPIGQSLRDIAAEPAPSIEPAVATPVRAPRRFSSRWLLASALVIGILGGAAFVSWRFPQVLPFDANVLPWNRALLPGSGEAPPPAPAPASPATPLRPDERISRQMIERLLARDDVGQALADAELWRDVLAESKVAATDERLVLLDKTIPELRKKLQASRGSSPPSAAEQCLDWLDKMRDAIRKKDLKAARQSAAEVETLVAAHPEVASRYRDRYDQQLGWLKQLEGEFPAGTEPKTAADVERLLKEALALATPERLTDAMEKRARALFLAPTARIEPGDDKKLTALEQEVTRAILRARGRRAVADARTCLVEGDDDALRALVAVAGTVLPEFSDEPDLLKLHEEAKSLAAMRSPRASGSDFGKRVLFRLDYEEALEAFKAGDPARGIEMLVSAWNRGASADDRRRVETLAFEALAAAAARAPILPEGSPERARRARAARAALDKAAPLWGDNARWKMLDDEVRRTESGPSR